jgi:poly [ADP-ribose] polymerase
MGIYFAPKAQKSIGYTSLSGSYWAGGRSEVGYMALMEVAYGTPYDVYDYHSKYHSLNYKSLQDFKKGANCLHAHAGASMGGSSSLRNDEIVIYKEAQCTIKYLVEIRN